MKRFFCVLFLAVFCFCFAREGFAAGEIGGVPFPRSPKKYSVAGGSIGGNFYLFGGGIASVLNKQLPKYFFFTSETTGGGSANLVMLQNDDAELGVAMASSMYESQRGVADWTRGQKLTNLRTAVALYPSWMTLYTLKSSGINTMKDLNGKIVGLGSKGMAMDSIFRQFFEDQGIVPKQIHNDGHGATATAMQNGIIDAALLFSYPPFAAISELESTKALNFISLTDKEEKALMTKYDFYTKGQIPVGSYKSIKTPVRTVTEWNMLVTSKEVPADDVYLITKTLCEKVDEMIKIHGSAKYITIENTLNSNIPLHEGTVRYMREKGIKVPDRLLPPEMKKK